MLEPNKVRQWIKVSYHFNGNIFAVSRRVAAEAAAIILPLVSIQIELSGLWYCHQDTEWHPQDWRSPFLHQHDDHCEQFGCKGSVRPMARLGRAAKTKTTQCSVRARDHEPEHPDWGTWWSRLEMIVFVLVYFPAVKELDLRCPKLPSIEKECNLYEEYSSDVVFSNQEIGDEDSDDEDSSDEDPFFLWGEETRRRGGNRPLAAGSEGSAYLGNCY